MKEKTFCCFMVRTSVLRFTSYRRKTAEKVSLEKKKTTLLGGFVRVGDDLFSRAASRQVFSARLSLTTVFGMGTGGTSML